MACKGPNVEKPQISEKEKPVYVDCITQPQSALLLRYDAADQIKKIQSWAGALVKWLKGETHIQKVVSSNPSARYWMDFFTLIC